MGFLATFVSIDNNSDELCRKQKKFKEEYSIYKEINPTFTELAKKLMESRLKPWDVNDFTNKTHLDSTMYCKINKKINKGWSFKTVLAFCVGIGANLYLATQILASAGFTFTSSEEHQVYAFLFKEFVGCSIDECNCFLESVGVEPLGSKTRSTDDNGENLNIHMAYR